MAGVAGEGETVVPPAGGVAAVVGQGHVGPLDGGEGDRAVHVGAFRGSGAAAFLAARQEVQEFDGDGGGLCRLVRGPADAHAVEAGVGRQGPGEDAGGDGPAVQDSGVAGTPGAPLAQRGRHLGDLRVRRGGSGAAGPGGLVEPDQGRVGGERVQDGGGLVQDGGHRLPGGTLLAFADADRT